MTTQAAFTIEEWILLRIVPSLTAGGVTAADPSGEEVLCETDALDA